MTATRSASARLPICRIGRPRVEGEKHEVHRRELGDVRFIDVVRMRKDVSMECVVNRLEVIDFERLALQLFERRCAGRPEGVMSEKAVAVNSSHGKTR